MRELKNISAKQKASRNIHKEGCGWLRVTFICAVSTPSSPAPKLSPRSRSSVREAVRKGEVTIA
jgi:hypothetical protein